MNIDVFLQQLTQSPESITFDQTMRVIESNYHFVPTAFQNGDLNNAAGQNSGSCKLFSFAKLQGLSTNQTLHCFGDYYRDDVLNNPTGSDHQNIRNFMAGDWEGITFAGKALTAR